MRKAVFIRKVWDQSEDMWQSTWTWFFLIIYKYERFTPHYTAPRYGIDILLNADYDNDVQFRKQVKVKYKLAIQWPWKSKKS